MSLFRPNYMIRVYHYRLNKVYMINVRTGKIYLHSQKINISTLTCMVLAGIINRIEENVRPYLYLNDFTQESKLLFIAIGVLMGVLLFLFLMKIRYKPQLEEYLDHYPEAEVVLFDINEVLNVGTISGIGIILGSIILLFLSRHLFNQFLSDSNLFSYIEATVIFLFFSSTITRIDHAIFLLKYAFDMA